MILPVLIAMAAGWINRHQQHVIRYLKEENRVLKSKLPGGRVPLSDTERCRLAALASPLARCSFAMEDGAVGLQHIPVTAEARKLAPWAAAGMPVGAQACRALASPDHHSPHAGKSAATCQSHGGVGLLGPWSRGHDRVALGCTQHARWLVRQASKRFRLSGTCVLGLDRLQPDRPLR